MRRKNQNPILFGSEVEDRWHHHRWVVTRITRTDVDLRRVDDPRVRWYGAPRSALIPTAAIGRLAA
jgi:hypothetical protein